MRKNDQEESLKNTQILRQINLQFMYNEFKVYDYRTVSSNRNQSALGKHFKYVIQFEQRFPSFNCLTVQSAIAHNNAGCAHRPPVKQQKEKFATQKVGQH